MFERDEYHVDRAIPEGSRKVRMGDNWLQAVADHPSLAWRREDFRRNVLSVATALLAGVDWVSLTSTPGNHWLSRMADVRSYVLGAAKRWLKAHGFLAMVANGRSAAFTPASSDGFSHIHTADRVPLGKMADRAVFVLTLPMNRDERFEAFQKDLERKENRGTLGVFLEAFREVVDVNRNPSEPKRKTTPKGNYEWASPTRKAYFEAAARETARLEAARTDLSWPRTKTTDAPDEATRSFNELQAARTVILYSPALRALSDRHVARILAPAFRSGYTARDILHAFDRMPDGTQHAHDGFSGALNIAGLIQSRLQHWRVDGQFVRSYTQRELARKTQAEAQRMAALQEHSRRLENQQDQASINRHGAAVARAVLRGHATINPTTGEVTLNER